MLMGVTALFPGSFDPFTKGHQEVVLRALELFDKIIIGMGYNFEKARYFDPHEMLSLIQETFSNNPRVSALIYNQLTAELAEIHQANVLLRGLRNTTDFEFENSVSQLNRQLNAKLETVFLITSPQHSSITSSLLREVHRYGGNIARYLPYELPKNIRILESKGY